MHEFTAVWALYHTRDAYVCLDLEEANNGSVFLVKRGDKERGEALASRARASATQSATLNLGSNPSQSNGARSLEGVVLCLAI